MTGGRVLISGGAGFLGRHLCRSLLEDSKEVICLDDFSSSHPKPLEDLHTYDKFTFIEQDVKRTEWILSTPSADEVYHLASIASPSHFTEDPVHIALANSLGTKNLLNYTDVSEAQMLYASTSEIYGDPQVHPQSEHYNGNVDPRGPRSCYDESKRFGEALCMAYYRQYDIDARTIRIFNTYGPGMRIHDDRAIPTFIRQALRDEDITVYGSGKQTRSFCYVSDTIRGMRAIMNDKGSVAEVYNIGRPDEITILSLAHMIKNMCNSDSNIVHRDLPEDDPSRRRPDIEKAQIRLDWEPEMKLRDGLSKTIKYFREEMDL